MVTLDKTKKCFILVYSEMKWDKVEKDFIGRYPQVIDAKNRVVLPSKYREILNKFYKTNKVYLVPDTFRISDTESFPYIRVLPPESWHKITDEPFEKTFMSEHTKRLSPIFWDSVSETMDKAGRIVLNQRLIKFAGIDKKIVIAGMKNWFQIWAENIFNDVYEKLSVKDLDELIIGQKEEKVT